MDKKFLYIVAGICLVGSLSLVGVFLYQKSATEKAYRVVDKDNTNIEISSDVLNKQTVGEINELDEDQRVDDVTEYKNVLSIPKCNVLANIYEGTSKTSLAKGVGHYEGTVEVGALGNCALAGHSSDTYKCILNEVKNLNLFDTFDAYDSEGKKHTYTVTSKQVVEPTVMSVLDTDDDKHSVVTIITCTEKGTKRLVIKGTELSDSEVEDYRANIFGSLYTKLDQISNSVAQKNDITKCFK